MKIGMCGMGKLCTRCKQEKPLNEFAKDKTRKHGRSYICVECSRKKALLYYHKNSKDIAAKRKTEEFKVNFRKYQSEWSKNKWETDQNYRIKRNMRVYLWKKLKGVHKAGTTFNLVGCTLEELKAHLENQFKLGMSWDNYGQPGWEIDHIRPCASYDLTKPEQQKECFHYTNLQPLWGIENATKKHKYKGEYKCVSV
jgi:hypothetical protein